MTTIIEKDILTKVEKDSLTKVEKDILTKVELKSYDDYEKPRKIKFDHDPDISDEDEMEINLNNSYENMISFIITGKDINTSFMNCIRRVMVRYIPMYAYDSVSIQKDNTIMIDEIIRLRFYLLPITNIKFDGKDINPRENVYKYYNDQNYMMSDIPVIRLSLNVFADQPEISMKLTNDNHYSITTDDAKFEVYGKSIENKEIYKYPIELSQIKKNNGLSLTCSCTKLGIQYDNIMWSGITVCSINEIEQNKCSITYECRKQIPAKEYLVRSLIILDIFMKRCVEKIKKIIGSYTTSTTILEKGKIIVEDEDETIGELLSEYAQNNENIQIFGYSTTTILERKIMITYELKPDYKKDITEILDDIVAYFSKLCGNLVIQIDKIKI